MTRFTVALLTICLVCPLLAADPPEEAKSGKAGAKQKVRLHVSGAYCLGCAGVLTEALTQGGVQDATKVPANRGRGYVIVLGEIASNFDLSGLAKAVNEADTPHKKQSKPGVALELFAALDEESSAKALTALADVPGVNGKQSSANAETGAISVKLSGQETVTVSGIIDALKKVGVQAKVVTEGEPKATSE